ncbi:MAG: ABC transporter ATP-binding protein [SAR202 cluster bacterium]|nr:ABC transporter ATP-binding protein [SAR202 cluster bacterium]
MGGAWGRRDNVNIDDEQGKLFDCEVVWRLLGYMAPYRRQVALAVLGVLVYTATTVAVPLLVQRGIDGYIAQGDLEGLNLLALAFAVVLAAQYAVNYGHQAVLGRVTQSVLFDLRRDLFAHLQRLPMSFHNRHKVGSVMSRVQNDVSTLQEFLNIMVVSLGDLISLAGIIVAMIVLDLRMSTAVVALLPLLVLVIAVWQRFARKAFLNVRTAIARVNGSLQENIAGVRVVQSMNRQDANLSKFNELNSANLNANLRAMSLSAVLMPAVELFTAAALAGAVVIGGSLVFGGTIEAGVLVAFALYIQRFFDPIRNLTMQFTQLQRAMTSGARIFELLDVEPDLRDAPDAKPLPPIRGEVRFEHVSFGYTKDKPVLEDVNLTVHPGQTVALVGPTGAGKTTLVALLARFHDVTGGRILIDGHDLREVPRASLARQMGTVLQEPFLFTGTIRENIRYSRADATRGRIEEAARAVGVHDYIMSLPDGYDTVLEERGGNLSVGQRQLISFARALVADPRILVLDEATASVDTETEQTIQRALKTLLAGRTAVVIAHRLSTVQHADQIAVIEQGRVAEVGTHRELLERGGLYAKHHALSRGAATPEAAG